MGHKVKPTGLRLGITEDWRSRWYAPKKDFSTYLVSDFRIREFIKKNYLFAAISKVEIERNGDEVQVILFTARPGIIIGRKGQEVDKLREQLERVAGRKVNIRIQEVSRPELSAQLVAESVREQLEKRSPFRRVVKQAVQTSMEAGAKGARVKVAGRLGGSEMSRHEGYAEGSIPLATLRARIDYGFAEAVTTYGHIGVKVWIYTGMMMDEKEFSHGVNAQASKISQEPAGSGEGAGNPR